MNSSAINNKPDKTEKMHKALAYLINNGIISEQQSAQEQLLQVKEYYEGIIRKMPGSVYWKNKDGVCLGCNDNMAQHFNMTPEDAVGKLDKEFVGEDIGKQIQENDRQIMLNGQEMIFEEITQKDGHKSYFLTRKVPMKNTENEVVGLIGISMDITEQKRREELQRQQAESLEKIQLMKGLAGAIAHELRTPLATIRAGVNAINQFYPKLLDGYKKAVITDVIKMPISPQKLTIFSEAFIGLLRQVDNCNTIIDTMLQNISVDEISNPVQHEYYSLYEIVQQAIDEYPLTDKEASLIHLNFQNDFNIKLPALQFKQIIWNLLKNAFYFIQEARKGEVYIFTERKNNHYELIFKDTSKGISAENLNRIFKQFYSTRINGTGLGLHFCGLVMKSLGGNIRCESELGVYTSFILEFPNKC